MKENIAKSIKKTMLEVSFKVRGAHMGSNLSCIDILVALYFDVLDISEEKFEERDVFMLSKAHSALALYCTLYHRGLISKEELDGYYINDGILPAHLDRFSCKYIEFSG